MFELDVHTLSRPDRFGATKLNKWEFASQVFGLLFQLAGSPHRIIREILGDSEEARYITAGFYMIPTGIATQEIFQFFGLGLEAFGGLMMWVFGVILVCFGILIVAKKHNL
jgi:hypothetical protein